MKKLHTLGVVLVSYLAGDAMAACSGPPVNQPALSTLVAGSSMRPQVDLITPLRLAGDYMNMTNS